MSNFFDRLPGDTPMERWLNAAVTAGGVDPEEMMDCYQFGRVGMQGTLRERIARVVDDHMADANWLVCRDIADEIMRLPEIAGACSALKGCSSILAEDAEALRAQGRDIAAEINEAQIQWNAELIAGIETGTAETVKQGSVPKG